MADKRIDQLDAAAALSGTEPLPVYQSSVTKRTTPDAIRDRAISSLGDLTAASSLTGAEIVGVAQSGNARRTTAQDIANLAPAQSLASLSDVTIASVSDGQVLTYDSVSGDWVNETPVTGVTTLAALTDVTITSAADGEVLTYDFGTGQWINAAPSGGGGLTGFTSEVNTTAPNTTTPAHAIQIDSASTNVDLILSAKGSGATLAQIPDGGTAGGNKRGTGATDWQKSRSSAAQVASGQNSTISGGNQNTASGSASVVSGGAGNNASGAQAFIGGGTSNTASSTYAVVAGGWINSASGAQSFIGGGFGNAASGERSWIPGGATASTRGIYGAHAWTSIIRASTAGDNQHFGMVVQNTTTDATATIITSNRSAASATNVNVLPNNSCWTGRIRVTGRSTGGDVYNVLYEVVAKRGASAATTTIADANPIHTFTDSGITGVSTSIVANTTRGSVEVEVTGLAATTIDWFAEFFGSQIAR